MVQVSILWYYGIPHWLFLIEDWRSWMFLTSDMCIVINSEVWQTCIYCFEKSHQNYLEQYGIDRYLCFWKVDNNISCWYYDSPSESMIIMYGLHLNGVQIKVATEHVATTLRSTGPPTQVCNSTITWCKFSWWCFNIQFRWIYSLVWHLANY